MGKFTDRFKNVFNSGADDDFDDDIYDDEYDNDMIDDDDIDEPTEKRGLFGGGKRAAQAEEKEPRDMGSSRSSNLFNSKPAKPAQSPRGTSRTAGGNEVCIFKPTSIEDSREITETLLQGKAVVVNFEGLHVEISQRIIDFISGSCYALDGNLQKISNFIFIATPNSVDISGDFQNLLSNDEGSYDISAFKPTLI